mgnify:CR=1 FL=1
MHSDRQNALTEYSLDGDNKRIAQTRADEWHDRANTLEEKAKQFSLNTNEQKYYRPVFEEDISKTFERKIEGETITIDTHKGNTLCDNVYISDEMKESKAEPVAAEKLEKQEENFQIGTIRWDSYTKSIEGGTDSASQVAKCLGTTGKAG